MTLATNKRARFDYHITDTLDAGVVLGGAEVKSVKAGNVSLAGSYITVSPYKAVLVGCHIGPYQYAANQGYHPTRPRQLLLTKAQITALLGKDKGLHLLPLEIYIGKRGLVKLRLGLGRTRKKTDKREYIHKREASKEAARALG